MRGQCTTKGLQSIGLYREEQKKPPKRGGGKFGGGNRLAAIFPRPVRHLIETRRIRGKLNNKVENSGAVKWGGGTFKTAFACGVDKGLWFMSADIWTGRQEETGF